MDDTVHGITQARILEWEPIPSPVDLPNQGIEPGSPASQVDSLLSYQKHIKKQRHYFADKGPSSQSYGLSSSHVWM